MRKMKRYKRYSPELKRELAKIKQERDFFKDAAVYFAKESK